MKKILVILMMVLLCSTAVMGQTKKRNTTKKRKAKTERTMTEFEKEQIFYKEHIDGLITLIMLFYGESSAKVNDFKILAAKENASKDFRITNYGVDTIYSLDCEYVINVKKDGTIDTLSTYNWGVEFDRASRYVEEEHEIHEAEKEYKKSLREAELLNAKVKNDRKKAEKELKKLSFSWIYDYTYFGKKKVGVKWDYRPENNKEFDNDEMLSSLSLWIGKETGDYYEFSTVKNGKKYTTVEIHFINGMTKYVDVYKNGKKKNNQKEAKYNIKGKISKTQWHCK